MSRKALHQRRPYHWELLLKSWQEDNSSSSNDGNDTDSSEESRQEASLSPAPLHDLLVTDSSNGKHKRNHPEDMLSPHPKRKRPKCKHTHHHYGSRRDPQHGSETHFHVSSSPAFFGLIEGIVSHESSLDDSYVHNVFLNGRVDCIPHTGRLLELPGEVRVGPWKADILHPTKGLLRDRMAALKNLRIRLRHVDSRPQQTTDDTTVSMVHVSTGRLGSFVSQGVAAALRKDPVLPQVGSISIVGFDGFTSSSDALTKAATVASDHLKACRAYAVQETTRKNKTYQQIVEGLLPVPPKQDETGHVGVSFLCQLQMKDDFHLLLARDEEGRIVAMDVVFDTSPVDRRSCPDSSRTQMPLGPLTEELLREHSRDLNPTLSDTGDLSPSSQGTHFSMLKDMVAHDPPAGPMENTVPAPDTTFEQEHQDANKLVSHIPKATPTPRTHRSKEHPMERLLADADGKVKDPEECMNEGAKPNGTLSLVTPGALTAQKSALIGLPQIAPDMSPTGVKKKLLSPLERTLASRDTIVESASSASSGSSEGSYQLSKLSSRKRTTLVIQDSESETESDSESDRLSEASTSSYAFDAGGRRSWLAKRRLASAAKASARMSMGPGIVEGRNGVDVKDDEDLTEEKSDVEEQSLSDEENESDGTDPTSDEEFHSDYELSSTVESDDEDRVVDDDADGAELVAFDDDYDIGDPLVYVLLEDDVRDLESAVACRWPSIHDVFYGVHDDQEHCEYSAEEMLNMPIDDDLLELDDESMGNLVSTPRRFLHALQLFTLFSIALWALSVPPPPYPVEPALPVFAKMTLSVDDIQKGG